MSCYTMSCYTGELFQEEVLDVCTWSWKGYVPYQRAMEIVKRSQPRGYDPTDPPTQAGNDLHALVCECLGLEVENYNELSLYTAVGSPLDRFHGVDAFFEWRGQVVTIDVKLPDLEAKADVILHEADIYNDEGKSNISGLTEKAKAIACLMSN